MLAGLLVLPAVLFLEACMLGRSENLGETPELSELSAVRPGIAGSVLLFGSFAPPDGQLTEGLCRLRARIVRLGPGGNPPALLHDGAGDVIDVSRPSERVLVALVRRIRPAPPGSDDVLRDFWVLRSEDSGATWRPLPVPSDGSLSYVEFADERRGWVTGYGKGFLTADGGASWTPLPDPPDGALQKNVLAFGPDGGALVFVGNRVQLRDRELRVVRSLDLGEGVKVDAFARADDARLVVFYRKGPSGGKDEPAGAIEVRLPGLDRGGEIAGLPTDFICDGTDGSRGRVLAAGARSGSASLLGISHQAYLLASGERAFRKLPYSNGLFKASVALDPVAGAIIAQATGGGPSRRVGARRASEKRGFLGLW